MTGKLDHIGVFVDRLEDAIPFYQTLINHGAPVIREVPEVGLRLAFFTKQGGAIVELIEAPAMPGMKHGELIVSLEVDDLEAEIARLQQAGIAIQHRKPSAALPLNRGWIAKEDGHGTIIELVPAGDVPRFVAGELTVEGAD